MAKKLITWNMTSDGDLLTAWSKDTSLYFASESNYISVFADRIDNIIRYIRKLDPDILCLQDVWGEIEPVFGDITIAAYIAKKTNMMVIGESYRNSEESFAYPGIKVIKKIDPGVATLIKHNTFKLSEVVNKAEQHGKTSLFGRGIGSPFVVNVLDNNLRIINCSLRLPTEIPSDYGIRPYVRQLMGRLYSYGFKQEDLCRSVVCGDFGIISSLHEYELTEEFNRTGELHDLLKGVQRERIYLGKQLKCNKIMFPGFEPIKEYRIREIYKTENFMSFNRPVMIEFDIHDNGGN